MHTRVNMSIFRAILMGNLEKLLSDMNGFQGQAMDGNDESEWDENKKIGQGQ